MCITIGGIRELRAKPRIDSSYSFEPRRLSTSRAGGSKPGSGSPTMVEEEGAGSRSVTQSALSSPRLAYLPVIDPMPINQQVSSY